LSRTNTHAFYESLTPHLQPRPQHTQKNKNRLTLVKQSGLTPLDAGQWPKFLAIYAGLYVGSNFLRPIRLSAALAAAPLVNRLIEAIEEKTRAPKVVAFGAVLALIAATTLTGIFGAIALLGGFPNGLPFALPFAPATAR
jgi:hypothetical protein